MLVTTSLSDFSVNIFFNLLLLLMVFEQVNKHSSQLAKLARFISPCAKFLVLALRSAFPPVMGEKVAPKLRTGSVPASALLTA